MIYSKFYKIWLKTCDLCGVAVVYSKIDFKKIKFDIWNEKLLNDYFITRNQYFKMQTCGYCVNSECGAYLLRPIGDGVWFDPEIYFDTADEYIYIF